MKLAVIALFVMLCTTIAHAEGITGEHLLLARDHRGVLYVGFAEEGRVAATYEDGLQVDLATGLGKLSGIAVNDARTVCVSSVSHGAVYCIDRKGLLSKTVCNITGAGDLVLTQDGDIIVVTSEGIKTFYINKQ